MSTTTLEITEIVKELCHLADVEYESTSEIVITPTEVTFHGFLRNEHGSSYIDPSTGELATKMICHART